jgi:hypothetical protein
VKYCAGARRGAHCGAAAANTNTVQRRTLTGQLNQIVPTFSMFPNMTEIRRLAAIITNQLSPNRFLLRRR